MQRVSLPSHQATSITQGQRGTYPGGAILEDLPFGLGIVGRSLLDLIRPLSHDLQAREHHRKPKKLERQELRVQRYRYVGMKGKVWFEKASQRLGAGPKARQNKGPTPPPPAAAARRAQGRAAPQIRRG